MQDIGDILQNRVLMVSLAACLLAQFLKLIFELIVHRKINMRV
ncbi:MAG: divergent PAP2 family protein, partial [Cyanobacteria bacterium P01_C01_bin.70]